MVVATSPMRSTSPRLRADISAPRPRAARRAMCSARSPLRSMSGSIRRIATISRRSSGVVSPLTNWCCTEWEISLMISSMTSSRWTSILAASRSPASRAWVAPAMASPTRAKTWAKSRSTSWGTGMVGQSGCSMTSGPETAGESSSSSLPYMRRVLPTDPKRHRPTLPGGLRPIRHGPCRGPIPRAVIHPPVTVAV